VNAGSFGRLAETEALVCDDTDGGIFFKPGKSCLGGG